MANSVEPRPILLSWRPHPGGGGRVKAHAEGPHLGLQFLLSYRRGLGLMNAEVLAGLKMLLFVIIQSFPERGPGQH